MKERSGFNEAGVRRVFQPVLRAFKVGTDTFITMNERVDRAIASRDPDEIRTTMSILLSKTFGAPDRVMSALEAALVSDAPKYTEENAVIRQVKEYFATENGRLAEVVRSHQSDVAVRNVRAKMMESELMAEVARANAGVSEMIVMKSRGMSDIMKDVARVDKGGLRQVLDLMWVVDILETGKSEEVVKERCDVCSRIRNRRIFSVVSNDPRRGGQ